MNRANVAAISDEELARLDARSDALLVRDAEDLALDEEDLAEAWDAACDDEGADYAALCTSRSRTSALADTDG